ncbi:ABC1 family-domain-containing protein, partial [Pavlovales sp. CCMP2436]
MGLGARFAWALALLCAGRADGVATGVAGGKSPLPPSSRQVALGRIQAMRRQAVMLPSELEPAPLSPTVAVDEGEIEYPGPLSGPQRLLRAATFWSRALPIVFSYLQLQASFNVRERMGETLDEAAMELEWDAQHTMGAAKLKETIETLMGFYVKTGQIIAARVDLFPRQYTDALSGLTDYVDAMPASLVKRVIEQELLTGTETFSDVFQWFDDEPLGAASIAQVHHARLTHKYGGMEVAVKVQRPAIEPKLLGDIANLKALAKPLRSVPSIPVDYYVVFSELEAQLADEFDFVKEVRTPLPVANLVTRRCLVMEYMDGIPLSRAKAQMEKRGIDPDGPEAQLFALKLLRALTDAFGRSILETGFFHADPHAGNLFVMKDGSIGLIDFGQVKQISGRAREALAKVIVALADRKSDDDPATYDMGELSPNSPVMELQSFPQDLVLVGRATVLIKGIAARLGVKWSLAREWAPIARSVLEQQRNPPRPGRTRFRAVLRTMREWCKGRAEKVATRLSPALRRRLASA